MYLYRLQTERYYETKLGALNSVDFGGRGEGTAARTVTPTIRGTCYRGLSIHHSTEGHVTVASAYITVPGDRLPWPQYTSQYRGTCYRGLSIHHSTVGHVTVASVYITVPGDMLPWPQYTSQYRVTSGAVAGWTLRDGMHGQQ
jgi:hypothetical protein